MSNTVKVSIIIPYLKDRGWLKEAVESAEKQDFDSFEVIVQQGDKTLGENINDALKKAKGQWIKILAEDDLLPENSIRDLYNEAVKGFDFVCGDAENFGDPEFMEGVELFWKGRVTTLRRMVFVNEIHGGTVLYNKNILIRVGGFDTDLWTGEEYDMNMCLLANGYKLGYCPEIVYRYRLHETNKSYFMSVYARIKRKEYIKEIRKRYYSYVL